MKAKPAVPAQAEKKQNKFLPLFINAWILIPAIAYFAMVNEYALNIPYGDDYDAVLDFLNKFVPAGFNEKISLLFSQHNEHRIVFSRIVFVLYYKIFGGVNFRHLIFIANLELVTIFFILLYFIRKAIPKYWNIAGFILSLSLFDPGNFENADFAMAGIQNYGVIMLFLLSILFYSFNKRKYLVPAIFFQAMVVFSSGNGIIACFFIVLFAVLLKDKIKIISAVASMLIFAPLYFLNYKKGSLAAGSSIGDSISYFIKQTGAIYNFDLAFILGLCVLVLLAVSIPVSKKLKWTANTEPFIVLLLFVFASMAIVAYFRSNVKGIQIFTSRYLIYPHLLTAILFVFGFIKLGERKIKWPVVIVFIMIMLSVFVQNREWGKSGFEVEYTRLINPDFVYPDKQRAKLVTEESCRLGIYCIQDER